MSNPYQYHRAPRWLLSLGGLLLLATTGCPSSSSGPSATEQCQALAEDTCDKLVGCLAELTGDKATAQDHKDCVDSVAKEAECSNAVSISSDYPKCIDVIKAASCDDVVGLDDNGDPAANDLPPVCNGVVLTK